MANENKQTGATGSATTSSGAWAKDQEIGNILGEQFDSSGEGAIFLLLGAKQGSNVTTRFGDSESVKMLVRKIDANHTPVGPAFECSTVESAIVSKLLQATADDFPAIVRYHEVPSKQAGGGVAHVLTFVRKPGDDATADLIESYGVAGDALRYADDLGGMGIKQPTPVAGEVTA